MQCRYCGRMNSAQSCACVYCGKPISSPPFNPEPGSRTVGASAEVRPEVRPLRPEFTGPATPPLAGQQPYLKPPPYADSYSFAEARDRAPPHTSVDYSGRPVRRWHAGWMVGIFVLGLGAGLAGAWWLNDHLKGLPWMEIGATVQAPQQKTVAGAT